MSITREVVDLAELKDAVSKLNQFFTDSGIKEGVAVAAMHVLIKLVEQASGITVEIEPCKEGMN